MTDLTPFKKDGMNPPDWTSVDNISGQKAKDPYRVLSENLNKKFEKKKLIYCTQEIKLEHVVDEYILWKPKLAKKIIESEGSKPKNIFKFILVELKKTK